MRQFKKMTTKRRLCLFYLIIFFFSVSVTAAQDKVIVIPLFDDQQTNGPPAPVPQTGQTTSYAIGDDGELKKGVPWPNPRFTDNGNGTVKDNLTGMIWLKNANCTSFYSGDSTGQNYRSWNNSLTAANSLTSSYCGLTDGSITGDWRLPNKKELESLIHHGVWFPAVPNTVGTGQWTEGDPFIGLQSNLYWSSTTVETSPGIAWFVNMGGGRPSNTEKTSEYWMWPVRGGN